MYQGQRNWIYSPFRFMQSPFEYLVDRYAKPPRKKFHNSVMSCFEMSLPEDGKKVLPLLPLSE